MYVWIFIGMSYLFGAMSGRKEKNTKQLKASSIICHGI